MSHKYEARVSWNRQSSEKFTDNRYSRAHEWSFDGGVTVREPWIQEQENWIFHHPIELMPGVRETLPRLFDGNQTIVVTKGRPDEQAGKLERSGLAGFFHAIEIVFEKDVTTYRDLVTKHHLDSSTTWMIGNSPRSDINPAKAAGLRTIFIPYHTTWQHEIEEISTNGPETLVLESFGQLRQHFA